MIFNSTAKTKCHDKSQTILRNKVFVISFEVYIVLSEINDVVEMYFSTNFFLNCYNLNIGFFVSPIKNNNNNNKTSVA